LPLDSPRGERPLMLRHIVSFRVAALAWSFATARILIVLAPICACGRNESASTPSTSMRAPDAEHVLLHVVDGRTGRELDDLEFTLGIGDTSVDPVVPCDVAPFTDEFPSIRWSSPIRVPRCLRRFGGAEHDLVVQTFAARAPGHAWNRIRVDTTTTGRRTVELWPAMIFAKVDARSSANVEWTATSSSEPNRSRRLEPRGGVICEHLDPGRWIIEASECVRGAGISITAQREVELKFGEVLVIEDDFRAELDARRQGLSNLPSVDVGWTDDVRCGYVDARNGITVREDLSIDVEAMCNGTRVPSDDLSVRWWCAAHVGASEAIEWTPPQVQAAEENDPRPWTIGVRHAGTWWIAIVPPPDFELPAARSIEATEGRTPRIVFELRPRHAAASSPVGVSIERTR